MHKNTETQTRRLTHRVVVQLDDGSIALSGETITAEAARPLSEPMSVSSKTGFADVIVISSLTRSG